MSRTDFAHLHVHSDTSFLDGLASPKEYVKEAVRLGQPALALTDHGNLCQAPSFYRACRDAGIVPNLGFEGYFVNSVSAAREEKNTERSHITVLARGARGYKVLSEFNTATWKQFYGKPLIDRALCEQLGDDAKHLNILSGCAGSQLSRLLQAGKEDEAVEELLWWRETFPRYYIEIMHHNTDFDFDLNTKLLTLAKRYGIKHVVTNDPHYAVAEDHAAQDALLAVQMGKDLDDPTRMRFDGDGYWLKSRAEMYRTFKAAGYEPWVFKEGAANGLALARASEPKVKAWDSKIWQIPKYPDVENSFAELKRLVLRRMRELGHRDDPVRVKQVSSELKTIDRTGIADFLLITRGVIKHVQSLGCRVGPGRGSVAGSLVAYYLEIHKVDPIKYKLRFDRFLNPDRPKMPDIDTDFQASKRYMAFDHSIEKYGVDNTMMVAAYGSMRVKAAFNSLAKAYGIGFAESHRLNKEIIESEDDAGERTYVLSPELTSSFPELTALLNRLADVKKSISAHPAGLIIADPAVKIREQVPEMYIPSSKRWVAAYDKKAIESMGFMKQDFLGLRCLDTIAECIKLIKDRRGIDVEPDDWIPDEEPGDAKVYKMLARGRTSGVFQMEGAVNQRGCRDVKPKSFEDLVSITSLYRTGPISAGYPAQFISNRIAGRESIEYLHPLLKPILDPTWGVILYQEQVMEIGQVLAGFDGVGVDEIKEAIKDKSSDAMDEMRPKFVSGCKAAHNISERVATKIWDIIEGYAGYGYNRSHAVAYTLLTYQTARLKMLYPIEFFAALLRTVPSSKDNAEKRDGYLRDAIVEGKATILAPDINASDVGATPTDASQDAIRFGLSDLKGIGDKVAQKLVEGRPEGGYETIEQVQAVANNVGTMRVLTNGSVLESLGVMGDVEETEALLNWTFRDQMVEWREQYDHVVTQPSRDGGQVDVVGMIYSVVRGVTKTGKPYMTWKIRWSVTQAYDVRMWSECQRLWDLQPGSVVRVTGEWQSRWLNITVASPNAIQVLSAVRIVREDA